MKGSKSSMRSKRTAERHLRLISRSSDLLQNGFGERLIGSIRRECVDHVVVLGEAHLRRIPAKYAAYYNELRTHRSLNKDAPIHRAIQYVGDIVSVPVLGGLHHRYCRNLVFGTHSPQNRFST